LNTPPPEILAVADELRRQMVARGLKLAVAESLTGGYLQALVSTAAGASEFFEGGVVAYSLQQKVAVLGIDRDHAAATNCVSPRVSLEMAQGVCRLMGADVGVATTGYASPDEEHQVTLPFAHIAIWRRRGAESGDVLFEGRFEKDAFRIEVQQYISHVALIELEKAVRCLVS
jgi:nicotinamide-nucleotide amidase